ACRTKCPPSGAPPGWPGCKGMCPDPPDPQNQACWDKVCPNPPTGRAKACKLKDFPPCDPAAPDMDHPKCLLKHDPVTARVLNAETRASDVVVTISAELEQDAAKRWVGHVLRVDSDSPLDGGDVAFIRVGKRE